MIIKNHPEKQEIKQVWEAGSVQENQQANLQRQNSDVNFISGNRLCILLFV